MRIAIFTDTFYPKIDGVAISTSNTVKGLAAKGHQVLIFCPDDLGKKREILLGKTVSIRRIFSLPLPSYREVRMVFPNRWKIIEETRAFNPDVLLMVTLGAMGLTALSCKRRLNIPLVGMYHTLFSEQLMYISPPRLLGMDKLFRKFFHRPYATWHYTPTFFKEGIWKLTLHYAKKCDSLIVPSAPIMQELKARNVAVPIHVISSGAPLDLIPLRRKKNTFAILHAGRISHEKNAEKIIEAFEMILKKIPRATLDIIGDGPSLENVKLKAQQLRLKNVRFHGYIPYNKLLHSYKNYDLFITASTMETLGMVVVEAMAAGLPVVAVNKFALPSLVINGKNGMLCEPGDVRCMSEASVRILSNQRLYKTFSKNSRKYAIPHSNATIILQMEQLLRRVARKN
jgi:glycosyltransferase involved in cell wall biosynthesis